MSKPRYAQDIPSHYYDISDVVQFPQLESQRHSLSVIDKMLIGNFIIMVRPRIILELGVFKGSTTRFICDFLAQNNLDAIVVGFDWIQNVEYLRENDETLRQYEAEGRLQFIPGILPDSLQNWLESTDRAVDLILLDSVKDYYSLTRQMQILWPRLSVVGYMICQDYAAPYYGACCALEDFAKRRDVWATVLTPPDRITIEDKRKESEYKQSHLFIMQHRRAAGTWKSRFRHRYIERIDRRFKDNPIWSKIFKPLILRFLTILLILSNKLTIRRRNNGLPG